MNNFFSMLGVFLPVFLIHLDLFAQSNLSIGEWGDPCRYNPWSVLVNPAGVAESKSFSAGSMYRSPFLVEKLAKYDVVISSPVHQSGVATIHLSREGYSLLSRNTASLAYGRIFGHLVSSGIKFSYHYDAFGNGYGSSSWMTASAGVIIKFSEKVRVGVAVDNPGRSRYRSELPLRSPSTMVAGISWIRGHHLTLHAACTRSENQPLSFNAGLEYRPHRNLGFFVKAGGSPQPFYFGYVFRRSRCDISMASSYHELLGFSPQFSVTFKK
jgi:hypothetical protein